MLEREKKKAIIISDKGEGIRKTVEKSGFNVIGIVAHAEWSIHIGEMEQCHLVILDEVDQDISGNLRLTDEEEILLRYGGPLVLVLVRDDDCRLDERAQVHKRWIVHHKSQHLEACLESLYLAVPGKYPAFLFPLS